MKAQVFSLTGTKKKEIILPPAFQTQYRPDLIKRAVLASQANRRQRYGPNILAGKRTSAAYWGTGMGLARVPRIKAGNKRSGRGRRGYRAKFRSFHAATRVAFIPSAVGGRRAHPPKTEKVLSHKINDKERLLAIKSALAATASRELVSQRGHLFDESKTLPIIVEDGLTGLKKVKEVEAALIAIGLGEELSRVAGRKIRSGKGKMRGRKYRTKTGPLIVTHDKKFSLGSNLPGVEVIDASSINAERLSPGAHGARLTIFTESALTSIGERLK